MTITPTFSEHDHHVRYTNANGYSGTVLIERGSNRLAQALDSAAGIRKSGGTVHEIVEITPHGPLVVEEPVNDDAKPRTARQAAVRSMQTREILSREIVATAQVHGGARVIEFAVIRHTLGHRTWSTYRVAAYDSNHPNAHHSMGVGPADTAYQIEDARADAQSLLTFGTDPQYCDCWSGWDPYCGKAGCWGVVSR